MQRKFHLMEGECYAFIWGIMHFKQYLYHNHFILHIEHKPLEWLAILSNAYGRRGRWIRDLSFKIVHRDGSKNGNVDALSKNPIGNVDEDEDFQKEIRVCD